ncbi:bifunctional DNA primase/polymerase [Corynebacterium ulcerans]|uniref:bifunctional DNA primase/polymerase n=1 Tax=Corynebacterium ulcerans TaxID=65058 RepID=UPI002FBF111B
MKCSHAELLGAVSHQHAMAIVYARWGIAVGALHGKVPVKLRGVLERGVKDFTTDETLIYRMWERYPNANIGGRPPRGCVVLDVDPRNGGAGTWEQINACKPAGWLPNTLTIRTGSGGLHEWYRMPYDLPVRGEAGTGIDIKTHKGYLVMPGSIHPTTGQSYVCERWQWPPTMLSEHWLKHVYKPPRPARRVSLLTARRGSGKGLVESMVNALDGERNRTLYWAACRAAEDGLDLDRELMEAALSVGLPEVEIRATLASAKNAEHKAVKFCA